MFSDVTQSLLKIQNEQRAQKVASTLNYGQLVKPTNAPSASYYGNVGNAIDTATGVNARWIATFTRSDGLQGAPFVDFPWQTTLDKGFYQDIMAAGYVSAVSGRDKRAIDEINFTEGLYEIGTNYVKWKIEVGGSNGSWFYSSSNGTGVSLTVQAVSMIPGTLTLVRVV